MILKDVTLESPEKNILYDEVLLSLAEQGKSGEILRFWESDTPFVVLGRISKEDEDLNKDLLSQDKVPVLRRSSGGGTVIQGNGCLNYTLILSKDSNKALNDIGKSYSFILSRVVAALSSLDVKTKFMPISDIALEDSNKKVSGNAQKRSKKYVLHHGTILYDFDLRLIERYLKIPKDTPEYRKGRGHSEFVDNLPSDRQQIKKALLEQFNVEPNSTGITSEEHSVLDGLVRSRDVNISLKQV